MDTGLLRHDDVTRRVDDRHWRIVLGRLEATFRTGGMVEGLGFLVRVVDEAEAMNHHPDVDVRYGTVHVALVSHDAHGLTERDVALAARISALADELALEAAPSAPQELAVAVDALDIPAVVPFWRAVTGYVDAEPDRPDRPDRPVDDGDPPVLVDPHWRGSAIWFQQMDEPRPQRNRIHLDVSVPHDIAEARVRAAVDAGGTLVSDARAPAFWVLADAEGNEVCVCTWQARD